VTRWILLCSRDALGADMFQLKSAISATSAAKQLLFGVQPRYMYR
jgi:hypothetical protein